MLLAGRSRRDPGFLWRVGALLRRERIRIVLSHGFSTGVAARLTAPVAGAACLVAEHSTGERDLTPLRHRVNRLLGPLTCGWIGLTPGQLPYLTETKGLPPGRIRLIPNGIDPDPFGKGDARDRIRRELGIPADAPAAGMLAVLRPEKDPRTFLLAARFVLDDLPEAHFLLVGDGPLLADMQREAGVLDMAERVHFTGRRTDIPALLDAFDVSVLCSTDVETLPLAFLESMAARLPLVGTRVGGLPDLIRPDENGALVEPRDPRGLADALLPRMRDPVRRRREGEASRTRVEADFTRTGMVRAYEALFEEVLAR